MKYIVPYKKELDNYKHITAKIYNLWGTKSCRAYLIGLTLNTAGRMNENPVGFSLGTFSALNEILAEHDKQFPEFKQKDIWDTV